MLTSKEKVSLAMKCVLVLEDEPAIADTIIYALKTDGFSPFWAKTCGEARKLLAEKKVDLAILDVGLPDGSGFELCKEIRTKSSLPVIFLTARADEVDRVVGLEIGGDDYVVKPFSPRELTARVKAVLRRSASKASEDAKPATIELGRFLLDEGRCSISFAGVQLELTRYEYRLLKILIESPGRVYSRRQLMDLAWEEPDISLERTVDSHIKTLRSKLRDIRPGENPIITHRGLGYSLEEKS